MMTDNRELDHPGKVSGNPDLPPFHFVAESRIEEVFKQCVSQKYAGLTCSVKYDKFVVEPSKSVATFCLHFSFPHV